MPSDSYNEKDKPKRYEHQNREVDMASFKPLVAVLNICMVV